MKLVATILLAAFVVAAGVSFAFANCAGHSKAQLVQSDDPKSSSDRVANNEALTTTPDKVVQSAKSDKALEKK
jgi:hypothetical protein